MYTTITITVGQVLSIDVQCSECITTQAYVIFTHTLNYIFYSVNKTKIIQRLHDLWARNVLINFYLNYLNNLSNIYIYYIFIITSKFKELKIHLHVYYLSGKIEVWNLNHCFLNSILISNT